MDGGFLSVVEVEENRTPHGHVLGSVGLRPNLAANDLGDVNPGVGAFVLLGKQSQIRDWNLQVFCDRAITEAFHAMAAGAVGGVHF